MAAALPEELLFSLTSSIPCRESHINQLLRLLGPTSISPPTLVLHGVEATGKTLTIEALLNAIATPSAIVRSRECITTRHLLEKAIASVKDALKAIPGTESSEKVTGRCENISAFTVELQHLLERRGRCYLVFDGIDRQREAAPTLLPAIARLGEIIPNLTTILILTSPLPHALHHSSIPHLHFPPYTKVEILSIACLKPLPLHPSAREGSAAETSPPPCTYSDEDCEWLWSKFVATIWDSLGQNAARDVVSFRTVCERLWRPFVQPVLDGHYGAREFSKLMIRNKALLQGESALLESIVPIPITTSTIKTAQPTAHTLPYYAAHLLCAAYLASHTPPKNDITLFSKTSLSKRKKRGGGTALTNRRVSKHRKISRRLLGPQAFVLERMFAIFHAVLPHEYKGGGADVMCQFATLAGLRLIVKAGVGAAAGDVLEGGTKWRVNVEWEFVRGVARGVGFDVDSYVVE